MSGDCWAFCESIRELPRICQCDIQNKVLVCPKEPAAEPASNYVTASTAAGDAFAGREAKLFLMLPWFLVAFRGCREEGFQGKDAIACILPSPCGSKVS